MAKRGGNLSIRLTGATVKHYPARMLEHLLDSDTFVPPMWEHLGEPPKYASQMEPHVVLDAQFETAKFLDGLVHPPDTLAPETATTVFGTLADTNATPDAQRASLQLLRTPDAVRQLVAMLTAYEWEFVEEANRIRSYVVGKLMEETTHDNARIRLRALELLGKVTEVALFTERMEVRSIDVSDEELEKRLRQKLSSVLTDDATDITSTSLPAAPTALPDV